jgi:hypothetical protein
MPELGSGIPDFVWLDAPVVDGPDEPGHDDAWDRPLESSISALKPKS